MARTVRMVVSIIARPALAAMSSAVGFLLSPTLVVLRHMVPPRRDRTTGSSSASLMVRAAQAPAASPRTPQRIRLRSIRITRAHPLMT